MNKHLITGLAVLGAAFACAPAGAAVTLSFNDVISGSPVGGPPFATVKIENAGADTVNFTMTNTMDGNVSAGQFISKLLLNVSPYVAGTMTWSSPTITGYTFSQDGNNDSGGKFDYEIRLETSNSGGNRFTAGKVLTWQVTGSGLTENSFEANSGGNQQYEAMIHVQAIPTDGSSAKVIPGAPVPEPASMLALGLGLAAFLKRRRA